MLRGASILVPIIMCIIAYEVEANVDDMINRVTDGYYDSPGCDTGHCPAQNNIL